VTNIDQHRPTSRRHGGPEATAPTANRMARAIDTAYTHHLAAAGPIPKIVHQVWVQWPPLNKVLPPLFKQWRAQCMALNPDYTFHLWDGSDLRAIANEHNMLDLYDSYDANVKRTDMARHLFLQKYGGIYMDLDMVCLRPWSEERERMLLHLNGTFLIANQLRHPQVDYCNGWMATPPHHPLTRRLLHEFPRRNSPKYNVFESVGNVLINEVLRSLPRGLWAGLPIDRVYGHQPNEMPRCKRWDACRRVFVNATTISMWAHSWWGRVKESLSWEQDGEAEDAVREERQVPQGEPERGRDGAKHGKHE
jgi:mannosyltransferase OCH1-like enzyme